MTTIDNLAVGTLTAKLFRSLAAASLLVGAAGICEAHVVQVSAHNVFNGNLLYTAEINPVDSSGCGVPGASFHPSS